MLVSVIIPVYNEEKWIETSLKKVTGIRLPIDAEFIVVDDGSTDKTPDIIKEFRKKSRKKIIAFRKKNGGKGSALRLGIKSASGDVITFHDGDAEYDPKDLSMLLKELLVLDKKHVVYGSRFMKKETNWAIPLHYIGNRLLSLLTTMLYGKRIEDMETCYKMFYAEALDGIGLMGKGFDIEPEITTKFLKKGLCIKEFPISYKPRKFGEGKKINYKDGIKAVFVIIRNRFFG